MVTVKVGSPYDQNTIRALIQEVQAGTDIPFCRSWMINLLWSKLDEETAANTDGGATYWHK